MKVKQAVARIAKILPLKKNLDRLDDAEAAIYNTVLTSFYHQGKAASLPQLLEVDAAASSHLQKLAQLDMLTLDSAGNVSGCYPFTMEQRVHRIQLNGYQVHAMCALDALAPAAMFECATVVDSECAVTGEAVHIELDNQQLLNAEAVAGLQFGINWMAANSCCSCSDSLCTEMVFLKDLASATGWQDEDPENREIFDLEQAIAFSVGLFKPMMSRVSSGS